MSESINDEWGDPGNCAFCGYKLQWARPGKAQETCDCYEVPHRCNHEWRFIERELAQARARIKMLQHDNDVLSGEYGKVQESVEEVNEALIKAREALRKIKYYAEGDSRKPDAIAREALREIDESGWRP